tara:strand:+ start:325 stop:486 length:162 start_codon:yes stop_codon:yes gene_type:complete
MPKTKKEEAPAVEVSLEEKLVNLKAQQAQVEQAYTKVQGAIEFCESLIKEKGK